MATSVVAAATNEAACLQMCGATSITDGCGFDSGGGPVRLVSRWSSSHGSSLAGSRGVAAGGAAGGAAVDGEAGAADGGWPPAAVAAGGAVAGGAAVTAGC
jgi:hypothetical protein